MKYSKYKLIILIIAVAIFNFSCSENYTEPTQTQHNFFPLKIGNYWVYESDSLYYGGGTIPGTHTTDSIIVEGRDTIENIEAFRLAIYKNGVFSENIYYSSDGTRLITLADSIDTEIPNFSSRWIKQADFSVQFWNVYNASLNNIPFDYNDTTLLAFGEFTINADLQNSDSITVVGVRTLGKLFRIKNDRRIQFDYFYQKGNDTSIHSVRLTRLRNSYIRFGENIGIVSIDFEPTRSFYTIIPDKPDLPKPNETYNGWRTELIRYKIN